MDRNVVLPGFMITLYGIPSEIIQLPSSGVSLMGILLAAVAVVSLTCTGDIAVFEATPTPQASNHVDDNEPVVN